jgi:CDP-glucose 4,6-dehydratase
VEKLGIPSPSFWRDKRVLVTGHTGFKGTWLMNWLNELGATTAGLSYSGYPKTILGNIDAQIDFNIDADIRGDDWQEKISNFQPQIIFHLAAQSLVYTGIINPQETFETNVIGSIHILELMDTITSIITVVIITTDKVYQIGNGDRPRIEEDPLGGVDPYSASKSAVELIAKAWPIGNEQSLLTARSGNVIGGGDAATKRLVPDLIRAWHSGEVISLRSPMGIRPWLHVLEPLRGYLLLAEFGFTQNSLRQSFNFAPSPDNHVMVKEIAQRALATLPSNHGFAIQEQSTIEFFETKELMLNATKAKTQLNWSPIWGWEKAVDITFNWYQKFYQGVNPTSLYKADLDFYVNDLESSLHG